MNEKGMAIRRKNERVVISPYLLARFKSSSLLCMRACHADVASSNICPFLSHLLVQMRIIFPLLLNRYVFDAEVETSGGRGTRAKAAVTGSGERRRVYFLVLFL